MLFLAQIDPATPLDPGQYDPSVNPDMYLPNPYSPLVWLSMLFGCGGWLYLPFLVWMAVYCARNDPERDVWLWIIILLAPVGPFIYFLARWLPTRNLRAPQQLRKWSRGREIERLRIAATQIGNAHQFVELGEVLRETGQLPEAAAAYASALQKDPRNLQALWGAACVDFQHQKFPEVRHKLSRVMEIDPAYKFGDVSLLYGKTLCALKESEAARVHLEAHTRRWRHPEGVYLLATIYADSGEVARARDQLQALIMDLDGSPRAIVRKQLFWKGRAKRMLRKLPTA
jgi:hypothetical protein